MGRRALAAFGRAKAALAPVTSVIIPTRNRAALLERVVNAFARQTMTGGGFELIIIDDGSTDHTAELLARLQRSHSSLRVVHQDHAGVAAARNRGIDVAEGEILLFCDDDMVPARGDFLARHASAQRQRCGAFVSRLIVPKALVSTPFHAYWRRKLHRGNARLPDGKMLGQSGFWFATLSLPKRLLAQERFSSAFHHYGWEDHELGYRLFKRGVRPYYLKAAEIYHEDAVDFASHLEKYYAMGRSAWTFYHLHPTLQVAVWTGVHPLARWYKKMTGIERRAAALKGRGPGEFSDEDYRVCLEAAYLKGVDDHETSFAAKGR